MAHSGTTTTDQTHLDDEDWRSFAKCRDRDPEMFFPQDRAFSVAYQAAKLVCRGCPVAMECLRFAIDFQCEGIWGGTTTHERQTKLGQIRGMNRDMQHVGHLKNETTGRCVTCARRTRMKSRGIYHQWSA